MEKTRSMYFEFANALKRKLSERLNGAIRYDIFSEQDVVVFRITFKTFHFSFVVKDIEENILSDKIDEIADEFIRQYKKTVNGAFFKDTDKVDLQIPVIKKAETKPSEYSFFRIGRR